MENAGVTHQQMWPPPPPSNIAKLLDALREIAILCDDAEERARFIARDDADAALTMALISNVRARLKLTVGWTNSGGSE